MRVQIPVYTDRWMMGDRYGEVVKVTRLRRPVKPDPVMGGSEYSEIAHVKLDKSGKTVRFILDDCSEV